MAVWLKYELIPVVITELESWVQARFSRAVTEKHGLTKATQLPILLHTYGIYAAAAHVYALSLMCCHYHCNAADKGLCAIRQHMCSFENNIWICKLQLILGRVENETVCRREHWSSSPFCSTVCLITELIYLFHYFISSPSHTCPDENSDYHPSMGQGGELNFHWSKLGKRGTVQKMQEGRDV